MSVDIETIVKQPWERYEVPEASVSGEFPSEPFVESEGDDDAEVETTSLALDQDYAGSEVRFDLAVTIGQGLDVASSEELAEQLREELKEEEELELISVEPRSYQDFPGVVQRMKLRESGEILMQWLIATPEDTVFAGVTFQDQRFDPIAERFFGGISISTEEVEED